MGFAIFKPIAKTSLCFKIKDNQHNASTWGRFWVERWGNRGVRFDKAEMNAFNGNCEYKINRF